MIIIFGNQEAFFTDLEKGIDAAAKMHGAVGYAGFNKSVSLLVESHEIHDLLELVKTGKVSVKELA